MQPLPIALPDFVGGALPDPAMARGVTQIITSNLQRSGLFAPIDQAAYIEKITNIDQVALSGLAADQRAGARDRHVSHASRMAGSAPASGSGTCSRPSISTARNTPTPPDNWRRIAHHISDAIYERLTGEKGYFDSRVVFIDESGSKERRVKRLAIMDQDGANVRYLTRGDDLVLTPRFSPTDAGSHLHVLWAGAAARLSAQSRDRAARGRRQFSGHDLLAALCARRAARDHEPAAGRQRQHLS